MMIDAPQIKNVDAVQVAKIALKVPCNEIQNEMGPGIQEVFRVLEEQGITPAGSWRTYHHHRPVTLFDFDICVPVSRPITPSGRVANGQTRAARVATTTYRGPYEQLGEGWGELESWIESQGFKTAEDLWEIYVVGPETGLDSSEYRTELFKPLLET